MKRTVCVAISILLLAACGATPAPTEPAAETTSFDEVGGRVWKWTELVDAQAADGSVEPDPEKYSLVFRADSSTLIQADCNVVGGTYDVQGDRLMIKVGPTTIEAAEYARREGMPG